MMLYIKCNFVLFCFVFEARFHYVSYADLTLVILLFMSSKSWGYRHETPGPTIVVYILVITKHKVLTLVTAQLSLEGVILNEVSQTHKDKCHMISYMEEVDYIGADNKIIASRV